MTTDTQIFRAVASRKLSTQRGAGFLMAQTRKREPRRPWWLPARVYTFPGVVIVAVLGSLLGPRHHQP